MEEKYFLSLRIYIPLSHVWTGNDIRPNSMWQDPPCRSTGCTFEEWSYQWWQPSGIPPHGHRYRLRFKWIHLWRKERSLSSHWYCRTWKQIYALPFPRRFFESLPLHQGMPKDSCILRRLWSLSWICPQGFFSITCSYQRTASGQSVQQVTRRTHIHIGFIPPPSQQYRYRHMH